MRRLPAHFTADNGSIPDCARTAEPTRPCFRSHDGTRSPLPLCLRRQVTVGMAGAPRRHAYRLLLVRANSNHGGLSSTRTAIRKPSFQLKCVLKWPMLSQRLVLELRWIKRSIVERGIPSKAASPNCQATEVSGSVCSIAVQTARQDRRVAHRCSTDAMAGWSAIGM